eukprot:m.290379 g.290379  ORF g.290379 m.290379 type:complete len:832 (-) comp12287_c0_seq1:220-2715(-)
MARVQAALLLLLLAASARGEIACTSTGGSYDCACSGTDVNCAYHGLISLPQLIPFKTTFLNMAGNEMKRVFRRSMDALTSLKTLNLRGNDISVVDVEAFDFTANLETLNLGDNRIAILDAGVFVQLKKLRTLYLDGNSLTAIPSTMFLLQTNLQYLHLENNRISSIATNAFATLTSLKELYLLGNKMTALPFGLFANPIALEKIYFDVNPELTIVPENLFANLTALSTLSMLGDPTVCRVSGGEIVCACGNGFIGDGFCEPINCGPQIQNLDPNAAATCTGNTVFEGTPCQASCNAGYLGGVETFNCGPDGIWQGTLECTPQQCGSAIVGLNANAHATCTGRTHVDGDDCVAYCNEGYTCSSGCTDDQMVYTCGVNGFWQPQGNALICERKDCGESVPGLSDNVVQPTCSSHLYEATCSADCKSGFEGGPAEFVCAADGQWFGALNCAGIECGRTILDMDPNASSRCRFDTTFGGTDCEAKCNQGWDANEETSSKMYRCTALGVWEPIEDPVACERVACPTEIPAELLEGIAVADCSEAHLFSDECKATCTSGYVGTTIFTCNTLGHWEGQLSCQPKNCGSSLQLKDPNAEATCTGDTRYKGDNCIARCKAGFHGSAVYECRNNSRPYWEPRDYRLTERYCFPLCSSTLPDSVPEHAVYSCNETWYGGFPCTATCGAGLVGQGEFTCNQDGDWEGDLACSAASTGGLETATIVPIIVVILLLVALAAGFIWYRRQQHSRKGYKRRREIGGKKHRASTKARASGKKKKSAPPPGLYEDGETIGMMMNPAASKQAWGGGSDIDYYESTTDLDFPAGISFPGRRGSVLEKLESV